MIRFSNDHESAEIACLIALYQRDMWAPAFMALLRLRVPILAEKRTRYCLRPSNIGVSLRQVWLTLHRFLYDQSPQRCQGRRRLAIDGVRYTRQNYVHMSTGAAVFEPCSTMGHHNQISRYVAGAKISETESFRGIIEYN